MVYQAPQGFSVWLPSPPAAGKCSLDQSGSYLAVAADLANRADIEQAAREPRQVLGMRGWAVYERSATPTGVPCLDFVLKPPTGRAWVRVLFPGQGVVLLEVGESANSPARDQLWTHFLTPIPQVDFWGHYYRRERDWFWSSFQRS